MHSHRRSSRKSTYVQNLYTDTIIQSVISRSDDLSSGLEIKQFEAKGRGIITKEAFEKGDVVLEYVGELIDLKEAKKRELVYDINNLKVGYMYFFRYFDKTYCIDASVETCRFGRLINHSRLNPNLKPKIVTVSAYPRLIFIAKHDIVPGTELLYDYAEKRKEVIAANPWLLE